jgi:aspartate beta-hydroxylase
LVHYGFVLKNLDQNYEKSVDFFREGIASQEPGTQDGRFYFHWGDALVRLGRKAEAMEVYEAGARNKLFLSKYQRSLYNVDRLKSRPFWTVAQTTYASNLNELKNNWRQIRNEALKILNEDGVFQNEAESLKAAGDWKQFELFARGQRVHRNCAQTPFTCSLIEKFPAARRCKRGQVKFSVMQPGTKVWPHCGPTNCRIRAHLGLVVPTGPYLTVAEQTRFVQSMRNDESYLKKLSFFWVRTWKEGEWLIFDDSFEHEVHHNGTSTRLVLIVDVWHPELTLQEQNTLTPI